MSVLAGGSSFSGSVMPMPAMQQSVQLQGVRSTHNTSFQNDNFIPQQQAQDSGKSGGAMSDSFDGRGTPTGEICLTLDISNQTTIRSAAWIESSSNCVFIEAKEACLIINSTCALALSVNDNKNKNLLDGMSFFDINTKSLDSMTIHPLKSLGSNKDIMTKFPNLTTNCAVSSEILTSHLLATFIVSSLTAFESNFSSQLTSEQNKSKSKKKKIKSNQISLVVPCYYNQQYISAAIKAIRTTGSPLKNIFNRAIATVAGTFLRLAEEDRVSLESKTQNFFKVNNEYFVLYLSVNDELEIFDAAIVGCEINTSPKQSVEFQAFERIHTVAVKHANESFKVSDLNILLEKLLNDSKLGNSNDIISAVVLSSEFSSVGIEKKDQTTSLINSTIQKAILFHALKDDSVKGGCYLSAAELESSKQYIQQDDDSWRMFYQLPFGDSFLSSDIAIQVEQSPTTKPEESPPEIIFSGGSRICKYDLGPSRVISSLKHLSKTFEKNFKSSDTSFFSSGLSSHSSPGIPEGKSDTWPKIRILERKSGFRDDESSWEIVETFHPLGDVDSGELVSTCALTFALDSSTGAVKYTAVRGEKVNDIKTRRSFWFRLFLGIAVCILLACGFKYGLHLQERSQIDRDVAWLSDIYRQENPEKLEDPKHVAKTIEKYRGKMWALKHSLERTYKKKFSPAPSMANDL